MRWLVLLMLLGTGLAHAAEDHVARARVDYMINCQGCHLPDGSGFPGKVPNMRGEVGKFLGVDGGREFLVLVPGAANAPIDNERLAHLMNWMLKEFSPAELPADFRPYDAAEVGKLRKSPFSSVVQLRERLVEGFGNGSGY
jgi:mono/diheme cytochrome c family protein